jgi:hypothetical protein
MRESFHKLFWGFLLVLIEIHLIVIDVLPDPLGYFFIYSGVQILSKTMTINKKAENLSLALIFISLPTMFVQNNPVNELGSVALLNGWSIYMTALGIAKLVLVYFIFKLMLYIVKDRRPRSLFNSTNSVFRVYMIVMLFNSLVQSFWMNMSGDLLISFTIFILISSIIVEVMFLVKLRQFMKIKDDAGQIPPERSSNFDVKA